MAARTPRSPLQNLPVCVWCPQAPTSTANQHTPRCELHTAAACESTATCGFSAPGAAAIRPPQAELREGAPKNPRTARFLSVLWRSEELFFCELSEILQKCLRTGLLSEYGAIQLVVRKTEKNHSNKFLRY